MICLLLLLTLSISAVSAAPPDSRPLVCAVASDDEPSTFAQINVAQFKTFAESSYGKSKMNVYYQNIDNFNDTNVTATFDFCVNTLKADIVFEVHSFIRPFLITLAQDNPNLAILNTLASPLTLPVWPPNYHFAVVQDFRSYFVKGAAAAYASKTGHIGMVLPVYDDYEMASCTNAFFLGMKSVNPNSTLSMAATVSAALNGFADDNTTVVALGELLASDTSIDVVAHQKAGFNVLDYIVDVVNPSRTSPMLVVENGFSTDMNATVLQEGTINPIILTASLYNFQPVFDNFSDSYLDHTLPNNSLVYVPSIKNTPLVTLSDFGPALGSYKKQLDNLVKEYITDNGNKLQDPLCGDLAQQYLGSTYTLVDGCMTQTDRLTGVLYAADITTRLSI